MSVIRRSLMNARGDKELPNYLCFTALESGTFSFTIRSNITTANLSYIEYSVDGGNSWTKTNNIQSTEVVITTPSVSTGDKVYWRGSGTTLGTALSNNKWCTFSSTGKFDANGYITSLLSPTGFENIEGDYNCQFCRLFKDSKIVDASGMILPSYTGANMFNEFFYNCVELTDAPNLPIVSAITESSYNQTFYRCVKLTSAPALNSNTIHAYGAYKMFRECTSLVNVPDINITSFNGTNQMQEMFYGCTSLIHCPIKSVPNDAVAYCYNSTFRNCTSLIDAFVLPATAPNNYAYANLFRDTKITYIKMYATDISATGCIWCCFYNLPNVSTSIVVKHIDAQWTTTGDNGVPSNWTIIYYDPAVDKYYTDQTRATECDDHGNPI